MAYVNRGIVLTRLDRYALAQKDFDKAIQVNPDNARAYKARGTLLKSLGKDDLANKDFEKACELDRSLC